MANPVDDRVDVFISHAGSDSDVAIWVDWILQNTFKLTTITDAYDFAFGDNLILKMNDALRRASRVVLLLSPASVGRRFVEAEWTSVLALEPGRLIPVKVVADVEVPPILASLLRADLSNKSRDEMVAELGRIFVPRVRPTSEPPLPNRPAAVTPPAAPVGPAAPAATIQALRADAIWIPPGNVVLGVDAEEEAFLADYVTVADLRYQGPPNEVKVAGFYLARCPTTNEEYWQFVQTVGYEVPRGAAALGAFVAWDAEARTPPNGLDDHPVTAVSWFDAAAYCQWVGGRLPTEAEWERAARGPDRRRWPFGDAWLDDAANTYESGRNTTVAVGTLSPGGDGPFGVADQAGNVWEWCSTLLRPYPYAAQDGRESRETEGRRVVRGGDWASDRWSATVSMRRGNEPTDKGATIGFRVAFDGPPSS